MRRSTLPLWVAMAAILFCVPALADKIVRKNGRVIDGRIIEIVGNQARIRLAIGATMTVSVDEIDRLEKEITEVTLKDGRTGRLVMAGGDAVILELKSGSRLRVTRDQVARTEEKVVVEKIQAVQIAGAPSDVRTTGRTVELLSLKSTLRQVLLKTVPARLPSGVIARTVGDDVYVSLGRLDGILIGDRLDVIRKGTKRASVGELEVTSTQPHLAVCRVVRGNAEQKSPAGEFNEVVLVDKAGAVSVSIGSVVVPEAAGISAADLREAIAKACAAHPRLRYSERPAFYEIAADASETPKGCSISLAVTERAGGRRVLQGKTSYRSKLNLAELGYKAAMIAELPAPPRLDATRSALVRLGLRPHDAAAGLFVPSVGPEGEDAWLLPDGAVIVASRRPLSDPTRFDALQATWKHVADATAGVTAGIRRDHLDPAFRKTVQFRTPKGGDFQFLVVGAWYSEYCVLDWPNTRPTWSVLLAHGPPCHIALAGRRLPSEGDWTKAALTHVPHGEHHLRLYCRWMTIATLFPAPGPRILLRDQAGNPKTERNVFSEPLNTLYVPASQAYCTFR